MAILAKEENMKNVLLATTLAFLSTAASAASWGENLVGKTFADERTQIRFVLGNAGNLQATQNELGDVWIIDVELLDASNPAGEQCMLLNPTDGTVTTGIFCLMADGTLQPIFGNQQLISE